MQRSVGGVTTGRVALTVNQTAIRNLIHQLDIYLNTLRFRRLWSVICCFDIEGRNIPGENLLKIFEDP